MRFEDASFAAKELEEWIQAEGITPHSVDRIMAALAISSSQQYLQDPGLQHPFLMIPRLTSSPWHDVNHFSFLKPVFDNAEGMGTELAQCLSVAAAQLHPEAAIFQGAWHRFMFFNRGTAFTRNLARCPITRSVLDAIPGASVCGWVYFSILGPATTIKPHCGAHNGKLRLHFTFTAPGEGCTLTVGGETRCWHKGEAFVFDDSFLHSAANATQAHRAVLLCDFWHPDLTEIERASLIFLRNKF